jgi:hypothetical protein
LGAELKVLRVDSHAINGQSLMVYFGVCVKENESVFGTVLDSNGARGAGEFKPGSG